MGTKTRGVVRPVGHKGVTFRADVRVFSDILDLPARRERDVTGSKTCRSGHPTVAGWYAEISPHLGAYLETAGGLGASSTVQSAPEIHRCQTPRSRRCHRVQPEGGSPRRFGPPRNALPRGGSLRGVAEARPRGATSRTGVGRPGQVGWVQPQGHPRTLRTARPTPGSRACLHTQLSCVSLLETLSPANDAMAVSGMSGLRPGRNSQN